MLLWLRVRACSVCVKDCHLCAAVCRGTNFGLTSSKGDVQYHTYQLLYTNCTVVDGNLEIVWMESPSYNFSFLKDIREVTGYVLIVSVFADVIPLHNLRVIRGRTLYYSSDTGQYYSLYVALNYKMDSRTIGLKQLPLVSLHGKKN